MSTGSAFTFSDTDLQKFSELSLDANPLHLSADFCRRTTYGKPIVFGVFVALSALRILKDRGGMRMKTCSLDFLSPAFTGVTYQPMVEAEDEASASLKVMDGSKLILKMKLDFFSAKARSLPEVPKTASVLSSLDLTGEDLKPGRTAKGKFQPGSSEIQAFMKDLQIEAKGLDAVDVASMFWTGYVVGMEMPGKRGLFGALRLKTLPTDSSLNEISYSAELVNFDTRFQRARVNAKLQASGSDLATAEITSYLLSETILAATDGNDYPVASDLKGKVALVVGASRGLGAEVAKILCARGCQVFGSYQQSDAEITAIEKWAEGKPGKIIPLKGDVSVEEVVAGLAKKADSAGGLDFILLASSPERLRMKLEPNSLGRILTFTQEAFRQVCVPLAHFAAHAERRKGTVAFVSSLELSNPASDLPHYLSAKAAAEMLVETAAKQFPGARFFSARAPLFSSDRNKTPMGGIRSESVSVIAQRLVDNLLADHPPGYSVVSLDKDAD